MKSILISIKPNYIADILNGRKTIEIRKTTPKCDLPIDVYIYCTKGQETCFLIANNSCKTIKGKVVAKFTLRNVEPLTRESVQEYDMTFNDWQTKTLNTRQLHSKAYLTYWEMLAYLDNKQGYAWHIEDLVIFDKPKELSEFVKHDNRHIRFGNCFIGFGGIERLTKAPQSYCFIESEEQK